MRRLRAAYDGTPIVSARIDSAVPSEKFRGSFAVRSSGETALSFAIGAEGRETGPSRLPLGRPFRTQGAAQRAITKVKKNVVMAIVVKHTTASWNDGGASA